MALNRKIAYIDLTSGEIQIKPIPLEVRRQFICFTITQPKELTRWGPTMSC